MMWSKASPAPRPQGYFCAVLAADSCTAAETELHLVRAHPTHLPLRRVPAAVLADPAEGGGEMEGNGEIEEKTEGMEILDLKVGG
eukprot:gene11464-biopygen7857